VSSYCTHRGDSDSRSLIAGYYSGWPIDASDYATSPGSNAHPGTALSSVNGYHIYDTFSLQNLSNISKTGHTGLRWAISGGQPTGSNKITANSYDDGSNQPYLTVNYTLPRRPTLIVVSQ
jgi:hypothetical protein